MWLKLLILAGVALAAWSALSRALSGGKPKPRLDAEDYARCPDCGAWRSRESPCGCDGPPTP